jgi:hypothetical protein
MKWGARPRRADPGEAAARFPPRECRWEEHTERTKSRWATSSELPAPVSTSTLPGRPAVVAKYRTPWKSSALSAPRAAATRRVARVARSEVLRRAWCPGLFSTPFGVPQSVPPDAVVSWHAQHALRSTSERATRCSPRIGMLSRPGSPRQLASQRRRETMAPNARVQNRRSRGRHECHLPGIVSNPHAGFVEVHLGKDLPFS